MPGVLRFEAARLEKQMQVMFLFWFVPVVLTLLLGIGMLYCRRINRGAVGIKQDRNASADELAENGKPFRFKSVLSDGPSRKHLALPRTTSTHRLKTFYQPFHENDD